MSARALVLAEDSPEDRELILAALERVVPAELVAPCSDGLKALDYLFARNAYGFRNPDEPLRDTVSLLGRYWLDLSIPPPSSHPG